jgi:hypothetical protein
MNPLSQIIDFMTMGSGHPIRRLVAYYAFLGIALFLLVRFVPSADDLLLGKGLSAVATADGGQILQDGLKGASTQAEAEMGTTSLLELATTTAMILFGTLVLMLPVSWVYMSARNIPGHSQAVVQTLIILPLVVAGIVLIVRDSLALAFSLAGVVAAVRFRTNLKDARDVVYVFLAIAVGFAAGVQTLAVGAVLTIVFNFVLLFTWRYDYGRNILTPTASSRWAEPLNALATNSDLAGVPDRDLVLSLTPDKAEALADRFERVSDVLGNKRKKPRYSAVLSIMSDHVAEAQQLVEKVLDEKAKRWRLDEVVTHTGKPSEIYYLVRLKKPVTRDDLLTAIRAQAGDFIANADLESKDPSDEDVRVVI